MANFTFFFLVTFLRIVESCLILINRPISLSLPSFSFIIENEFIRKTSIKNRSVELSSIIVILHQFVLLVKIKFPFLTSMIINMPFLYVPVFTDSVRLRAWLNGKALAKRVQHFIQHHTTLMFYEMLHSFGHLVVSCFILLYLVLSCCILLYEV